MPLETTVAMSQDQIGYWLSQTIENAFTQNHKHKKVATIVSQVVVNKNDPVFNNPTKPIGAFYSEKNAKSLTKEKGWAVKEDAGCGWRRVVAPPKPIDIVEKATIKQLVADGVVVIAADGGGIPVYRAKIIKKIKGIDAVIDKDFAAEKLAELIGADIFISVTAVPNAYINFGLPNQQPLHQISIKEAKNLTRYGYFKSGSMLPKIQATIEFANYSNKIGIITDIEHLESALKGKSGTIITKS